MLSRRGCCCTASTCLTFFSVKGCNSLGLVGATINVWTDATKATLIATGTTGSSPAGFVQLDIGSPRSVYWEASKSRFVTGNHTATIATCGVDTGGTITLTPATGYHCKGIGCADPWADTLHCTDALGNATTLTFSATPSPGWYGTSPTWDYPGCGSCAAVAGYSYALRIQQSTGSLQVDWVRDGTGACPGSASDPGYDIAGTNQSDACPPTAVITNSITSGSYLLLCQTAPATTFTTTE